jgi:hypothetical protein
MKMLPLALPRIRRSFSALAYAALPHPYVPGPPRAGAERPAEPCYMTLLFGGRPTRRG